MHHSCSSKPNRLRVFPSLPLLSTYTPTRSYISPPTRSLRLPRRLMQPKALLWRCRSPTPSDSSHKQQSRSGSPRCSAGRTDCRRRWKSSLPWHPSAAECGRHTSLSIHLPYRFAQSNCWIGRSNGRRSHPFGSLPCGRSGRLP